MKKIPQLHQIFPIRDFKFQAAFQQKIHKTLLQAWPPQVVGMPSEMKNGQVCFSLWKFPTISLVTSKTASNRSRNAVMHPG